MENNGEGIHKRLQNIKPFMYKNLTVEIVEEVLNKWWKEYEEKNRFVIYMINNNKNNDNGNDKRRKRRRTSTERFYGFNRCNTRRSRKRVH